MFHEDIAVLIEGAGLATRSGPTRTLLIGSGALIPEGSGPFCSLIESLGGPPLLTHDRPGGVAYQQPRMQIVWRGPGDVIRQKAMATYHALFVTNATVNGTWYLRIFPLQEPFDLPPDDNRRPRVAFNVEAVKRPA